MLTKFSLVSAIVNRVPAVRPYLKGRARWIACASLYHPNYSDYKSYDYFKATVEHLVKQVYSNNMGGEFIDIMANLIQGQLTDSYTQAWEDDGNETGMIPDYLTNAANEDILNQYDFVDRFFHDIIDARLANTPIDGLINRAGMWANQYNTSYHKAILLITEQEGGKLQWMMGPTEQHCRTCSSMDGVVAYASEWNQSKIQPGSHALECHGYNCQCELVVVTGRRSPNALQKILNEQSFGDA